MVEFTDEIIRIRVINISRGLSTTLFEHSVDQFAGEFDIPDENYINVIPEKYKDEYKEVINFCKETFKNREADEIHLIEIE